MAFRQCFLVDVFEEKARLLQWLFFVSSTRSVHFFCSFVQLLGREVNPDFLGSEKQESMGSSLALNHKVFFMLSKVEGRPKCLPFSFFFQHYAIFFRKFLNSIKGYPLNFLKFSVCKKRLMSVKGLFFGFLAICDFFYQILFLKKKFPSFSNCCSLNILEP